MQLSVTARCPIPARWHERCVGYTGITFNPESNKAAFVYNFAGETAEIRAGADVDLQHAGDAIGVAAGVNVRL
ncbi:MAG: hypothetical protein E6J90_21810 [Deltaproteobacteria bacterium]|nr:MAG: hypothetical protein E6J91_47715 [Deltaproteobacteria bacterium]TMQ17764.1 MAG: hypothetical protein E6J90_21810 [Deltaproteobacteria bacterium]